MTTRLGKSDGIMESTEASCIYDSDAPLRGETVKATVARKATPEDTAEANNFSVLSEEVCANKECSAFLPSSADQVLKFTEATEELDDSTENNLANAARIVDKVSSSGMCPVLLTRSLNENKSFFSQDFSASSIGVKEDLNIADMNVREPLTGITSFCIDAYSNNKQDIFHTKMFSSTTGEAMENFYKLRDYVKKHLTPPKTPEEKTNHSSADPLDAKDEEDGKSLMSNIRTAIESANSIDHENAGAHKLVDQHMHGHPKDSHEAEAVVPHLRDMHQVLKDRYDWRDDDLVVTSSQAFFCNRTILSACNRYPMESIIRKVTTTEEELSCLYHNSSLFHMLKREEIARIVSKSLRREYIHDDTVLEPNSSVNHLYTVVWGNVEVFRVCTQDNEREAIEGTFRVASRLQPSPRRISLSSFCMNGSVLPQLSMEREPNPSDEPFYIHMATLRPGQVFGTESVVFHEKSKYLFVAGNAEPKTVVALLPSEELLSALATNPQLAQAIGSSITSSIDIFAPIRQFCRFVFSSQTSQNEYLPLWSIVESYTKIHNVIHTKIFHKTLDTGAWSYALNRLPENLTSTFCFDLVHSLPSFVASRMRVEARAADVRRTQLSTLDENVSRTLITYVRTKERRRCTWNLGMEGKTLVLLRDGFTDLLDFLTMLCVHIIESNKLRGRIQGMLHPPAIDILDAYLRQTKTEKKETQVEELKQIRGVLALMPLTQEEQAGLVRNWGTKTLLRIYEVMMHREEYNVRIDPSISRKFQSHPFHEWAINLRSSVLETLGLDRFSAFPADLVVDVVSSNTHCIKNLLSSFIYRNREEIETYLKANGNEKLGNAADWHVPEDRLYVALKDFLQNCRPDLKEEFKRSLDECGIIVLNDTAMTGLEVDVIPVHSLNLNHIDKTVRKSLQRRGEGMANSNKSDSTCLSASQLGDNVRRPIKTDSSASSHTTLSYRLPRHFIINMDFAFGAQAEGICCALFNAFGKHIRSVSVMGKAGGLVGKRGDIQLASHVLLSKSSLIMEDDQDELRNCRNQDLSVKRLRELAGPRISIHHGKVLTVTGTLLQNESLLMYYKRVWQCIGVEMEGSYFARVTEDFYRQGIANRNLITRFAYYTSDLPLLQYEIKKEESDILLATLSASMTPLEGVPPLYAIARAILENILVCKEY